MGRKQEMSTVVFLTLKTLLHCHSSSSNMLTLETRKGRRALALGMPIKTPIQRHPFLMTVPQYLTSITCSPGAAHPSYHIDLRWPCHGHVFLRDHFFGNEHAYDGQSVAFASHHGLLLHKLIFRRFKHEIGQDENVPREQ